MKRYKIDVTQMGNIIFKEECPDGEWVKHEDIQKEFGERCDCCGEYGRERRTLRMSCGHDMYELDIPFAENKADGITGSNVGRLFTLQVCKHCRGNWMTAIKEWFEKHGEE